MNNDNLQPSCRELCPRCGFYYVKIIINIGAKGICPGCGCQWEPSSPYFLDTAFNLKVQPAIDDIYRLLWGKGISLKRELGAIDKDRGIDVIAELPSGIPLSIQEKARRQKYRHYWEFTVEYKNNPKTNEKGEFYKLAAQYYFYGYCTEGEDDFTDWWLVDLNKFKMGYHSGEIKPKKEVPNKNRSNATFLTFDWDFFESIVGLIAYSSGRFPVEALPLNADKLIAKPFQSNMFFGTQPQPAEGDKE